MPYLGQNWPDTDTESRRQYSYDFSDSVPLGDAITAVVWELTVHPNSTYVALDPASSTKTDTPGQVGNVVTVWADDLLENVRYKLTAFITTTSGVKDDLYSYIQVNRKP